MSERPPIPERIKTLVYARDGGICRACGTPVPRHLAEFDHRPALWLRKRDNAYPRSDPRHYIPNANDPEFIETLHGKRTEEKCHDRRTFGNGVQLGDVQANAKSKRLTHKQHLHEAALAERFGIPLTPEQIAARAKQRPKRKLPSRPIRGWRNTRGEIVWAKPREDR